MHKGPLSAYLWQRVCRLLEKLKTISQMSVGNLNI